MPGVAVEKRHLTFHQHAEKRIHTAFARSRDDLPWTALPGGRGHKRVVV